MSYHMMRQYKENGTFPMWPNNRVKEAEVKRLAPRYELEDGVLYYKLGNRRLVVPPPNIRKNIAIQVHRISHDRGNELDKKIKETYFRDRMALEVFMQLTSAMNAEVESSLIRSQQFFDHL